tara:strand:+ start:11901 stop:13484 length:1584 start_codon:yes stop_codon:yes gene_type:complete
MNSEEEQSYQEQSAYQEQIPEYYQDEAVYKEQVQPMVDLSILKMPFWLQTTLLGSLVLVLGVSTWLGYGRYQGFQITQIDMPVEESWPTLASGTDSISPSLSVPAAQQPPQNVVASGWFYSNRVNLKFQLPSGWVEVGENILNLPPGISDTKFVLLQPETGCVIAGGDFDREAADYVQTSFGGRVVGDISQYDGSWFTNQAYHPKAIEFSDNTRQYLSYELRHTYNLDDIDLMLWNSNLSSVRESCNEDFESLLSSISHHYQIGRPETYETVDFFIKGIRYQSGDSLSKLVYKSGIDGNTYEVLTLSAKPTNTALFFTDGRLYYVGSKKQSVGILASSANNQIYYVDLNTYEQGVVNRLDPITHPLIASLYVVGNDLYYLSGPDDIYRCVDGPSRDCSLALNKIPLDSPADASVLATSTPATSFVGYSSEQDALFMETGYGDAGCVGVQLYIFENGGVSTGPELGGCIQNMVDGTSDAGYAEYRSEMDTLEEEVEVPSSNAIYKAYGKYSPSNNEEISSRNTIYFVD